MKKLGFMSWYAIIASTLVTCLLDAYAMQVWQSYGGFNAWRQAVSWWDISLASMTMWHMMYAFVLWLVYDCNKED